MSIINDALKKAARQRAQEEGDLAHLMPGTHRAQASRGEKKRNSTQTYVLVAAGAVALIVVSVVVSGILFTGKSQPAPIAAVKPTPEPSEAPAAVVQLPAVALVAVPKAISSQPTPAPAIVYQPAPTAVPTAIPTPVPTAVPTPVPTAVPTSPPAAAYAEVPAISLHPPTPAPPIAATPSAQAHNDLVQGLVDGLKVSGVRAAGAESKALIDGHVYRINDVLDRATGLRLVGVEPDRVTFVDAMGVSYVKSF
jgi:hypothetical protein